MPLETSTPRRRVHIVGGGPVGLMLTALLQTTGEYDIRLYEKRSHYTRTRMVKLDTYLVADSVENYCMDYIDGENVEAVFDRTDLEAGVASRQSFRRTFGRCCCSGRSGSVRSTPSSSRSAI